MEMMWAQEHRRTAMGTEPQSVTMGKVSEVGTLLARIYDESRPLAIQNEGFVIFFSPSRQILRYYFMLDHDSLPLPSNYRHGVFELLNASLNKLPIRNCS
jgi:hypothetical protein